MSKKNPDFCERAFCRELWTKIVSGMAKNKRGWVIRLCDRHAQIYEERTDKDIGSPFVSYRRIN